MDPVEPNMVRHDISWGIHHEGGMDNIASQNSNIDGGHKDKTLKSRCHQQTATNWDARHGTVGDSNPGMERGTAHHTISFGENDDGSDASLMQSKEYQSYHHEELLRAKLSATTEFDQRMKDTINFDTVPLHDGPSNDDGSESSGGDSCSDHDEGSNQQLIQEFTNELNNVTLGEVAYIDQDFYDNYEAERGQQQKQRNRGEDQYFHDQLPLIDEYKAGVRHNTKFNLLPALSKHLLRRPDPPEFSPVDSQDNFELSAIQCEDADDIDPVNQFSQDEEAELVDPNLETFSSTMSDDDMCVVHRPSSVNGRSSKQCGGFIWRFTCSATTTCCGFIILFVFFVLRQLTIKAGFGVSSPSRLDDVINFLANEGYSKLDLLRTPGTPQSRASTWIADVDPLQLGFDMPDHRDFISRYSLVVLFYALGGDENYSESTWRDNLNFLSGHSICAWLGSVLNDVGENVTKGVRCQKVGKRNVPSGLNLSFNGLKGTIPEEIQYLDGFEILILQDNPGIGGVLPKSMHDLSSLRVLSIHNCSLSGTIPDWIGDLTNMVNLGLSSNRLSGEIPRTIESLTNLKALGLDNNMLNADLTQFDTLTKLQYLYLNDNEIRGTLTSSLLLSWKDMVELDISDNYLSSTLPENIFSHGSLMLLDLHGNRLTGSIPIVSSHDTNQLEFLALHANELEHVVPNSLGLLQKLTHLDLSMNRLASALPSTIGSMFELKYLSVGSNIFNRSPIPSWLGELTNLEQLKLSESQFLGSIPDFIGFNLSNLKHIDLSQNSLTSTIPESIGFLSSLENLILESNQLTGKLPGSIVKLSSMDVLVLDGNNLAGSADVVCDNLELEFFAADCGGGQDAKFKCVCCSVCCRGDQDEGCYDLGWSMDQSFVNENNFERSRYKLGDGTMFIP